MLSKEMTDAVESGQGTALYPSTDVVMMQELSFLVARVDALAERLEAREERLDALEKQARKGNAA